MSSDETDEVESILDALDEATDRPLTPDDVGRLKGALFENRAAFRDVLYGDQSYFVIGSYDAEEERRLEMVKTVLDGRRPNDHAFLMKDVPEFTRNFTLKFHVLARRVDRVVGVFEHDRGGHEWEAGALSAAPLRGKTWALKRAYPTTEEERAAFDAMLAHFLELLDERDRLVEWTTDEELRERAETRIP